MKHNMQLDRRSLSYVMLAGIIAVVAWMLLSARPAPVSVPEPVDSGSSEPEPLAVADDNIRTISEILSRLPQLVPTEDKDAYAATSIWFASGGYIYVEYARASGAPDRMIALREPDGVLDSFERIAVYYAGENDWEAVDGQDMRFAYPPRELYKLNEPAARWEKQN